ncbi:DUF389 domain-containing protein [Demequina sp. SYSU T00192]|uniref:DUF389 domain-containing protein n=1 Tax=Demequina litoralis TaxID=3051660 RepID=A0ABT8GBH7_9MICO|nr:DUF389 domain-containing protein [Demequina sp. SYSU T00192]MDN4476332.1 DUF389 domain-containing protein [Demequina sp. SYSU T00192]
MEGASHEAIPTVREQLTDMARAMANGASLRGLALVVAGAVVLALPAATTWIAQVLAIGALGVTGLMDVFYSVTGRRWLGRRINRIVAALRGLMTTAIAALLAWIAFLDPTGGALSLAGVVAAVGVYVAFRGLIGVIDVLVRRNRRERLVKLAVSGLALAGGVLAAQVPESIARTALVSSATTSIIVGFILIAWGIRRAESGVGLDPSRASIAQVLWDWIRGSDIGDEARSEHVDSLFFENPGRLNKLGTWWVMLALSVAIATFAVLADSTAVVIGAMLVAPLMTPIVGLAGALVNGWARRAFHSAGLVAGGVAAAIAISYGLAAWSPVAIAFSTNSQIVSRVTPSTIDMLIALAAGAAGAYATVNKRVASGIAGVAIAVALVPPLAVVGVSLSGERWADAGGAFLLFLTNFVAIVLAACVVFVATGFAQPRVLRRNPRRMLLTLSPFVILAAIVLLPLMLTAEGQLNTSSRDRAAEKAVEDWLGEDTEFAIRDVHVTGQVVDVTVEGPGETPSVDALQRELLDTLDQAIAVRITVVPVTVTELPVASPSPSFG